MRQQYQRLPGSSPFLPLAIASLALAAPAQAGEPYTTCGKASWYALTSRTASGERMDPAQLTAAHPSLPFGTRLLVRNPGNDRSVIVRINDRGPFTGNRIIDVSKAAARQLGFLTRGVTRLCITTRLPVRSPAPRPRAARPPAPQ